MGYPDVKNSKEEEDHWIALSAFERERFELHANFLIDQGQLYLSVCRWVEGRVSRKDTACRLIRAQSLGSL